MMVNSCLQSVDHAFIFGAGDCISFSEFQYIKKVGVYPIREAPYLYNNILEFIKNDDLKEYIPQKSYLAIISAGNKKAIMLYKGIAIMGRLSWRLKDYIYGVFMRKFRFYE